MSSGVASRVIQTQHLVQRNLMQIEQSVEDISDMFLKVYFILDAVPEEATSSVTVVSPALWDEYLQAFLCIAARCRRNLHDAVAVMDVCREIVFIDISQSSRADARTGLLSAEDLMRTKLACGRSAVNDLRKLAQSIRALRNRLDLLPTVRHRRAGTGWIVPPYREVVRYMGVIRTSFQIYAKMFHHHLTNTLRGSIGHIYVVFIFVQRIVGRRLFGLHADAPRPSSEYVNGYTLSGQICSAQLVTSEPDQSLYPYPDKIKGNLARIAVDIERFALTWSKISDDIERWATYLARRAESLADSKVPEESDLSFCNEIAGTWDAIMSMRQATLQRMHACGRPGFEGV